MVETIKTLGPSGTLQFGSYNLTVDNGRILRDNEVVGVLHDDGLLTGFAAPLGPWDGLKTIEELPGANFSGVDSLGLQLTVPAATRGPTGGLIYNKKVPLNVIFGRVATRDHRRVGFMADDGTLHVHDYRFGGMLRKLDENSQLATVFQGIKSTGAPWQYEFKNSLYKEDKSYWENEIIRYFKDIGIVTPDQVAYVYETMRLYAQCGILQSARKFLRCDAALGNVKHGAAGVTGVLNANATLDREQFDKEVVLYAQYGAFHVARAPGFLEVRLNLVVAHEFGHQVEFCLSKASTDKVEDMFTRREKMSDRLHPVPEEMHGRGEYVTPQKYEQRVFISGYSRSSWHEYWAEAIGAFAVREGREELKNRDPEVYQMLCEMVYQPEKIFNVNLHESILALQASLRLGGEMHEGLLNN